jgi:hypothetical protein
MARRLTTIKNGLIPSYSYQEIAGSIPASVTVLFYRSGNTTMLSVILLAIFQRVGNFLVFFPALQHWCKFVRSPAPLLTAASWLLAAARKLMML